MRAPPARNKGTLFFAVPLLQGHRLWGQALGFLGFRLIGLMITGLSLGVWGFQGVLEFGLKGLGAHLSAPHKHHCKGLQTPKKHDV